MAQWGRNDTGVTVTSSTTKETSNGAPIGTYALVKGDQVNRVDGANAHFGNTSSGSRASTDLNMYGNVTIGAFMPNVAKGIFAVNASMMATVGGNVVLAYVTSGGSGYNANAAVTLTVTNGGTGAVVNAQSGTTNSNTGRIIALKIQTPGSSYVTPPTVTIAAPAAQGLTPNTAGVIAATDFIKLSSANSYWQVGDQLFYGVATGNTAIAGLTGNTTYYIAFANTTGIVLSATAGGANIDLTEARTSATAETGHTIQGQTATGYVDVNTDNPLVSHVGWVLRTEGTGGRAGRIQYETLVAMGSLGCNTTTATGVVGNIDTITSNTVDQYV
jgi:hypothetical protein